MQGIMKTVDNFLQKNGCSLFADFEETAFYGDLERLYIRKLMHNDSPCFKRGNKRLVVCEHGHLALRARHCHRVRVAAEDIFVYFCDGEFHVMWSEFVLEKIVWPSEARRPEDFFERIIRGILLPDCVDAALHVEVVFVLVVVFTVQNLAERTDGVCNRNIDAWNA